MKGIKVIGFDLDDTLYPPTPEIQNKVRLKIYEKLASGLEVPVRQAEVLFETNYNGNFPWKGSGKRTIEHLGEEYKKVLNGTIIVQQSIEEADIIDFIQPNPLLDVMIKSLGDKFFIDLISGSSFKSVYEKLDRLGIKRSRFSFIIAQKVFGDKSTGDVYKYWLSQRGFLPEQHLYAGDNENQDIVAPKILGMKTCLVGKRSDLADICINEILDLEEALNQLN